MRLFNEIAERETRRNEAVAADYRELVVALAAGHFEIELENVERVLGSAGKTSADLQRDVQRRIERDRLRDVISKSAAAERERPVIMEKIQRAQEKLQAAQQEFHVTTCPWRFRLDEINQLSLECQSAQRRLQDGARSEIQHQLNAYQVQLNDVGGRVQRQLDAIDRLNQCLDQARTDRAVDLIKSLQQKIAAAEQELESLRAGEAALLREQERILDDALEM